MEHPQNPVVVDANLAKSESWRVSRTKLYAPGLWECEVVSALRKAVPAGLLTPESAEQALDYLVQIGVQRIEPWLEVHREALRWANRLGHAVAYDAQYLAAAAYLGAELRTADRRLADRAHEQGATWVRHISPSL